MSIARTGKNAGWFLAALVLSLALPIHGEEPGQDTASSASAPDSSPEASEKGESKPDKKPLPAAPESIQTPVESPTPPTNLRKVGDHWTPYQPPDPESFPEGAQIHIIVNRDTLWDLSNAHFGDPYLWPQIWNENRYILDSHWIYPGDPVLLPPRPTIVTEIVPATGQTGSPAPPTSAPPSETSPVPGGTPDRIARTTPSPEPMAPAVAPVPIPAADQTEIYCTGDIRPDYEKTDLYIANEEQEGKVGLSEGDLVYLNGGSEENRVRPGDEFMIIAKEGEVHHPLTNKWLGTYVRRFGRAKVLAVQDRTSIAQITGTCGDRIEVGFELEPFREMLVPPLRTTEFNRLDTEPSGKANGYVVHLQDNMTRAYTDKILDVDLGSRDGLKPGDLLLVYLKNVPPAQRRVNYNYKWKNRRYESLRLRSDDSHLPYPRKPIAQLIVLRTSEKTATAKVITAIREIEVGNPVEIR